MKPGIRNKVFGYITQKLGAFEYRRGWFKLDCPLCKGPGKMGIHLTKDWVHCFKCGHASRFIPFLQQIEDLEQPQALAVLRDYSLSEYLPKKEPIVERTEVTLPESFKLIIFARTRFGKMAQSYLRKRGLDLLTLAKNKIGYCDRGPFKGYIIFPYFDREGKLTYFQTRRFFGKGPKFKNPKVEDFGVSRTTILYNEQALYQYPEVFVFESVINCLTVGDNSIGLSGKYLSKYNLTKILQSPVKELIIGLDSDAYEEAIKIGFTLLNHKKVRIIKFPEGKDANDLGREEVLRLKKASRILDRKELMRLKYHKNRV